MASGDMRVRRRVSRVIAVNAVVDSAGTGAYLSAAVLYFTRFGGMSPSAYGLGLAVAGLIGMLASTPVCSLADRFPVKHVVVCIAVWRAAGFAVLAFVHGLAVFVLVLSALYLFDRSAGPLYQALIGALLTGTDRTRAMAVTRSARNVGFSVGFLTAGVALHIGTPAAYRGLFFLNSASFIAMAVLIASLPATKRHREPASSRGERAAGAVPPARNRFFVGVTLSNAVLFLYAALLLSVLPLWTADHTKAPLWIITVMLLVNTAFAVGGQLKAVASVNDPTSAARAATRSAVYMTLSCAMLAISGITTNSYEAVAVLLAAIVFLSLAEILHSTAACQVSYDLAPPGRQGAYLGFFNTGLSSVEFFGAAPILYLISHLGDITWLIVASLFPIAAWGNRLSVRGAAAALGLGGTPSAECTDTASRP